MDLSKAFPSNYLKKEDIDQNKDTVLTIKSGTLEEVGQEREERPVLWFEEIKAGLVMNKTNVSRIFAAHKATDTDELRGKKISLYVDHEVGFGGKTVGGIRIRATAPDEYVTHSTEVPF